MNRLLRYLLLLLLPLGCMADVTGVSGTTHAGISTANLHITDVYQQEKLSGQSIAQTQAAIRSDIHLSEAESAGSAMDKLDNTFKPERIERELQLERDASQAFMQNAPQLVALTAEQLGDLKAHEIRQTAQQLDQQALAQTSDPEQRAILQQRIDKRQQELDANQANYEQWKEGGTARNLLHAAAGGLLAGNWQGAASSYAASASAPALNRLDNPLFNRLAAPAMGALIGAGEMGSIMAAGGTDWNNRLPHKRAYDQLSEAQKERYNFYIDNGILPYEHYRDAYNQCIDNHCRSRVEVMWREADQKVAELDKKGIASGHLTYERHFNDLPHEDFQANTLRGFEQNSSLDRREAASWAGYFGGGTSEADIAQYAQNHALRSGGMTQEQADNYQWWGNVYNATLLPNDIRFGQGTFGYNRPTVRNNPEVRKLNTKTETDTKQPNFTLNGEPYLPSSASVQPNATVRLSQPQRLSDGRQLPVDTVVTTSGNAMKATLPDGTVIRGNADKLLKPSQAITYTPSTFALTENRAVKIFGTRKGHIIDTPENRKMFLEIANDPNSIRGYDIHKHGWHEKILPNGKQVWVQTRNEKIWNAGINDTPRSYNPGTGFAAPNKPT